MKKVLCLLLLAVTLSFFGCGDGQWYTTDFFAFDTANYIKVRFESKSKEKESAENARALCEELDVRFSPYNKESELFRINSAGGGELSKDMFSLLSRSVEIAEKTSGAFDPALFRLVRLWGIDGSTFRVPEKNEIADCLDMCGFRNISMNQTHLTLNNGAELDFGASAKGYVSDRVINYLAASGCKKAVVSLGGNVAVFSDDGSYLFRVGIDDPHNPGKTVGYIETQGGYISVSGSYERYSELDGVRYSHVLVPGTGYPVDNSIACVAVYSQSGILSDALSTALLVMGYQAATELYKSSGLEFGAIFVFEDNTVEYTDNLEGMFYKTDANNNS